MSGDSRLTGEVQRAIRTAVEKIPVADRPWNDNLVGPITEAVMDVIAERVIRDA